ncbi:MAG TPA: hypothetical protein VFS00_11295, partial [Polyangiaceae bacterium]|nr:hypothetical protein [Polyangiaceae bacterium]
ASGAGGAGANGAGGAGASGAGGGPSGAGDAERPPTDAAAMAAWIDAKYYADWACEPEPTRKTDGSPGIHAHATSNRVCSNALMASTDRAAGGEWPAGAAAVKEIYGSSGEIVNYAVALKTGAASDGGRGWYWYEGTGAGAIAGFGVGLCTGCHGAASSDEGHPGAGDYVYFRVEAP